MGDVVVGDHTPGLWFSRRREMLVAGLIVTAEREMADEVARRLARVPSLTIYGVHKGVEVVGVAEAYDAEQIRNLARYIRDSFEGVRAVLTTVGS
jgi:nitrate reductase NapAB chaperone NapD